MLTVEQAPFAVETKLTHTSCIVQLGTKRYSIACASRKDSKRAINTTCANPHTHLSPPEEVLFALLAERNSPVNNIPLVVMAIDMLYRILDELAESSSSIPHCEFNDIVKSGMNVKTLYMLASLHGWERAKVIAALCTYLWKEKGHDILPWSIQPVFDTTQDDPRLSTALMALLGIAAESVPRTFIEKSVPYSLDLHTTDTGVGEYITNTDVFLDWLVISNGTRPLPSEVMIEKLGMPIESTSKIAADVLDLEMDTLSGQLVLAAKQMSTTLLDDVQRPPRYINEVLEIQIDHTLLPILERWGIGKLQVSPRLNGLYVRPIDIEGLPIKCFWWEALPQNAENVPNAMRGSIWPIMHLVLSSLWHDFCAPTEVLQHQLTPTTHTNPNRSQIPSKSNHKSRKTILPPRRYVWGTESERTAIRTAHSVASSYRVLPQGWKNREEKTDFVARREAAIQRAAAYGYPAPPLGMTFVKPHQRGIIDEQDPALVKEVQARGLHTLALVLASDGRFAEQEDV